MSVIILGGSPLSQGRLLSPGNPLTNGVQAYYSFDEVSGMRLDSVSHGVGPAAKLTRANNEFLSRVDAAGLEPGASDFMAQAWVRFDGNLTSEQTIMGKSLTTGNQRSWRVVKMATSSFFQFLVSVDGVTFTTLTTPIAAEIGPWYHVLAWRDATLGTLNVQINGGVVFSTSQVGGAFNSTSAMELGRSGSSSNALDGALVSCALWIGSGLPSGEGHRQELYNAGRGRTYLSLSDGLKTALVSWWNLSEFSSGAGAISRADSHGSNTLTDNNTVTTTTGIGPALHDVNTVTSVAGQVGTAAVFTAANLEQLVGGPIHDSSDTDQSFHGLAYLAAKATDQTILSKLTGAGTTEYELYYDTSSDVWRWTVYDGTNAIGTVDAVTLGAVSTATWYWLYVWHSATDNQVGIRAASVAGALGAADTAATTGAASSGTAAAFRFGANGSGSPQYLGGRLDAWVRQNRLLTSNEQTEAFAAAVAAQSFPWAA